MAIQSLEEIIRDGVQGLPPEALSEIADFIYFLRKKHLHPQEFEEEIRSLTLRANLKGLSETETQHLEEEFVNYEQRFPRE